MTLKDSNSRRLKIRDGGDKVKCTRYDDLVWCCISHYDDLDAAFDDGNDVDEDVDDLNDDGDDDI